jgi:hypothetical protein
MEDDTRDTSKVSSMVFGLESKVPLHVDLDVRIHPADPLPDLGNVLSDEVELPCWV